MDKQNRKELRAAYKEQKDIGGICAIKNTANGKTLILPVNNLRAYQSRFAFSQQTGSCVEEKLLSEWEKYGAQSFTLEVLEELEKMEEQTPKEFRDDLKTLKDIWLERFEAKQLY
ncbi:MAG TPA: GIY-YIG nuclease family protein [Syntrophomonas sp.]|jgi:hypothetical protein|nr:GIY-YIG nuclease family protein [Syntrophomonas sp.]HRW12316.1 GIY-YIG nuclease family protein [Syntrophomonas sp.]